MRWKIGIPSSTPNRLTLSIDERYKILYISIQLAEIASQTSNLLEGTSTSPLSTFLSTAKKTKRKAVSSFFQPDIGISYVQGNDSQKKAQMMKTRPGCLFPRGMDERYIQSRRKKGHAHNRNRPYIHLVPFFLSFQNLTKKKEKKT